jgi:sporulation protein YlmC with PRC-barrel domain
MGRANVRETQVPERAGGYCRDVLGKEIRCQDGPVGQVVDVLVDPLTERPSHLIWREAVIVTREVSIPIEYVERIEDERIVLRVKREAVDRLPHFWTADPGDPTQEAAVEGY